MMPVLLVHSSVELTDMLNRAGVSTVPCESAEALSRISQSAGLAVDWTAASSDGDRDAVLELLAEASALGLPAIVVFERMTSADIVEVILRHSSVALPLERRHCADTGPTVVADLLTPVPPSGDTAVRIGRSFEMPRDPEGYRAERGLSLISPRMRDFLTDLRLSLAQMLRVDPMTRLPYAPPWDSQDSLPPARREVRGGGAKRPSWELDRGRGRVNLIDLFYAHDDERSQSILRNSPNGKLFDDRPQWAVLPPKLLILGESGTGKTLVAELVHRLLAPQGQLVKINCGSLESRNLDHELFGSIEGAWTDISTLPGLLARAAYGVAFFDEIGDLPEASQIRMLTYLDDLMVRPMGMAAFFGFSHVVAATNRDLASRVASRKFRHDLLARFQARVTLPPLRDRGPAEIVELVDFAAQNPLVNPQRGPDLSVTHIEAGALERLAGHDYRDGNFRELEQIVHGAIRSAIRARSPVVRESDVDLPATAHYRADDDAAVVRIGSAVENLGDRVIEMDSLGELKRLSDLRAQPILVDPSGTAGVVDGEVVYVLRQRVGLEER